MARMAAQKDIWSHGMAYASTCEKNEGKRARTKKIFKFKKMRQGYGDLAKRGMRKKSKTNPAKTNKRTRKCHRIDKIAHARIF